MPERTHYSVGSYPSQEIGKIVGHAREKRIECETIEGPRKDYQLSDGSKITVPDNQTAVVLVTDDVKQVQHFWDSFEFPKGRE